MGEGEAVGDSGVGTHKISRSRVLPGSRKSRPDRTYENPRGSGRAGPTSGAQRTGELQHAAEGRHQLRQRLHVLAGVRH